MFFPFAVKSKIIYWFLKKDEEFALFPLKKFL